MSEKSMFGGNPTRPEEIRKEINSGEHEYRHEKKESEVIKEVTTKSPEVIGKIFGGPYIEGFTEALSQGKTFEEADKAGHLACDKYEEEFDPNVSASRSGKVTSESEMEYESRSGTKYKLSQIKPGEFKFVYPDTSSISSSLNLLGATSAEQVKQLMDENKEWYEYQQKRLDDYLMEKYGNTERSRTIN